MRKDGLLTLSDTGIDSYADKKESRLQKFALVNAAIDQMTEKSELGQTRRATNEHLDRLKECVEGSLDEMIE